MVLAVTKALVARTIDDNDESGAVSAALTIARSSRSVVFLALLLPSYAVCGRGSAMTANIV